ncbi:MAG: 4a-hydroxytetrahydrobiopterin dehydratase [Actinomycetota bacterium]|nr:4a-hydroxytetrahydrobiopterin dehydratase [Actinomycetota bacterium]
MTALSQEEIQTALGQLDGWEAAETEISRQFTFDNFRQSVAFVVSAAFEAEAANHHPDLDVRYDKVHVTLSTHSEGGVTAKDIDLARALDALHR